MYLLLVMMIFNLDNLLLDKVAPVTWIFSTFSWYTL